MNSFINSYKIFMDDNSMITRFPMITGIGHELRDNNEIYFFDCKQKKESVCILQYTLDGEGVLEVEGGQVFSQSKGSIFMAERPGPYKYYISPNTGYWEFRFVSISFSVLPIWNKITSTFGRVNRLNPDCGIDKVISDLILNIDSNNLNDVYENTCTTFDLMIELQSNLANTKRISSDSIAVEQCIAFINEEYHKNITQTDIAKSGGLSPFALCRKFKEIIGETPVEYLTKTRIMQSLELLDGTEMPIHEIAHKCGFSDANYFAKVFKRECMVTPSKYRNSRVKKRNKKLEYVQI